MILVKGRELLIPENERYIGTTYDDNSTIRTFRIPRFCEDGMDKSQLDFYLIFNYDNGYVPSPAGVVKSVSDDYIVLEWDVNEDITEHSGCLFAWVRGFDYTGAVRWSSFPGVFYVETSGTEPTDLSDLEQRISEEDKLIRLAKLYKSQPMTAATAAEMVNRDRIYVYVGDEAGYIRGNWYFWDGSAWTSGGVYNAVAVQTDQMLTLEGMAADAKAVGDNFGVLTGDRYTLKPMDAGSTLDGYEYCSFSSGVNFAGHEIYAFRASHGHYTQSGNYGTILFYERTGVDTFTPLSVPLAYDSATYGELRDPNLSVSRDGTRLYVTCFTSFDESSSTHHSLIFVIDQTFTQLGVIITQNTVFWGNTLETPDGYLVHADYAGNYINIYNSSAAVTDSNVGSISMTKVVTLTRPSGYESTEPTIGYYKDRLVCFIRTGSGHASYFAYTYDLTGASGWTAWVSLGYILHAPCIPCYSAGKYLLYTASIQNRYITGNNAKRMPYIGLLDLNTPSDMRRAGALLDEPGTWGDNGYGGYTTLVRIDDARYGVMYYDDTSSGSTITQGLYFRIANINTLLGLNESIEAEYADEIKEFNPTEAAVYNNSLLQWVQAALNGTYKQFTFAVNVNSALITDIPADAQTTNVIMGHACRRGNANFVDLYWYNGNTNRHALIQWGNLNTAKWFEEGALFEDVTFNVTGTTENPGVYVDLPYKSGFIATKTCIMSMTYAKKVIFSVPSLAAVSGGYGQYIIGVIADNDSTPCDITMRVYYESQVSTF